MNVNAPGGEQHFQDRKNQNLDFHTSQIPFSRSRIGSILQVRPRLEQREDFDVAFGAEHWAWRGPRHVEAEGDDLIDYRFDDRLHPVRRQHSFEEQFRISFIMRLDQTNCLSARFHRPPDGGKNMPLFCPRDIDRHQIHLFIQLDVHGVGAFHYHHAPVTPQFPIERAVARVNRINLGCAALEHAVGESAGIGSEIGADEAVHVHSERAQGVVELFPGAGDETAHSLYCIVDSSPRADGRCLMKRILVLSASVGAGHMRAAQAVELALRQLAPDALVKNIDILTLTNPGFRRVYGKAYLDLVNLAPHVLGYVYDLLDKPRSPDSKRDRFRLAIEKLNLKKFCDLMGEGNWDIVVNTHFLPAEIIASLRRDQKLSVPQITVTTDFETHRLWVNQPCERYTTATEEGAAYLRHWGVPAESILITGIPIHPVFSQPKSRDECLKNQGLVGDRPIVLQLAGGFGVGPIEKLFRGLLSIDVPLEIVVVAGRNEQVKRELEQIQPPHKHRIKILGFTDQIDELMAVADVVVSKPGGLTTSEVLARGAAMAIVNPIPGQESRNSDYLLENGAAIKINNVATLPLKLTQLLRDPHRLETLKQNARRIARPQAAFDVARMALHWGPAEARFPSPEHAPPDAHH